MKWDKTSRLVGLCAVLFAAATAVIAEVPAPLAVEVAIAPATGVQGAYTCTARVTDATGEVVSEPMIVFRSGEEAMLRSGLQVQGKPAEVLLAVSADSTKQTAEVRVELVAGESRFTLQSLKVQL